MMAGMTNPIGTLLRARDGGLAAPFDAAVFSRIQAQAEPDATGAGMEVAGVGVQYGVVGHFPGIGALRLEAGAIVEAPGRHQRYRDVMGLYSHKAENVLARVGANTMDIEYGEENILYRMRLNPRDRMAADVWARLVRGDLNAASIGFVPLEADWVEGYDNGLDADDKRKGEKIDILAVTSADLIEISIVGQGAFSGATSQPAERKSAPVKAELPLSYQTTYERHPEPVNDGPPKTVQVAAAVWERLLGQDRTADDARLEAHMQAAYAEWMRGEAAGHPDRQPAADSVSVDVLRKTAEGGRVWADVKTAETIADADQSAPADLGEGDTGDVTGGGGETANRPTGEGGEDVGGQASGTGPAAWVETQEALMRERRIGPLV